MTGWILYAIIQVISLKIEMERLEMGELFRVASLRLNCIFFLRSFKFVVVSLSIVIVIVLMNVFFILTYEININYLFQKI